jgi:hypothetical protein
MDDMSTGMRDLAVTAQHADSVHGNIAMTAAGSPSDPGFNRADDSVPRVTAIELGDSARHLERGERS